MNKPVSAQRARERALFLYSNALERGDFDTVSRILQQAERDPILERMIAEMDALAEIPADEQQTITRMVHKSDGIEQIITVRRPSSDGQTLESDLSQEDFNMVSTIQEFEQVQPRLRPSGMRWLTLIAAVLVVLLMAVLTVIVFRAGFVSNPLLLGGQVEPTPTPSPTPISTPEVITKDNADKVELLQVFGYGVVYDMDWSGDGTAITLLTDKNYIAQFNPDQLDKLPSFIQPADQAGQTISYVDIALSPNDDLLAVSRGLVSLYDQESGSEHVTIQAAGISLLTFNTDGTLVAGSSRLRKTAFVWNTSMGEEISQMKYAEAFATALAFSPDGSLLAVGYSDNQMRLWEVATGTLLATMTGHTNEVMSVTFREEEKTIASVDKDGRILLWDWKAVTGTQRVIQRRQGEEVNWATFSPDGNLLAMAGDDHTIRLWDMNEGTEKGVLTGHTDAVRKMIFSPDGSRLASVSPDETLRLWDVVSGAEVARTKLARGHTQILSALITPDGKLMASGSSDGTIRIWDMASGAEKAILTAHTGPVYGLALSPDGQILSSNGQDSVIRLWDLASGRLLNEFKGHTGVLMGTMFSPDGKQLASSGSDKTVRLWDVATGESQVIKGHGSWGLTYSADGNTLLFPGIDGHVRLWDLATNRERMPSTPSPLSNGAFSRSPVSTLISFSATDGKVWWWDYATGEGHALEGHIGGGEGTFSADGKLFVSADYQAANMRLWDVSTATQLSIYNTNGYAAFSPDGTKVIVGTYRGAIELWGVPLSGG